MTKKKFNSKVSAYLYKQYIAGDPVGEQAYKEEVVNAEIARKICDLSIKAGLSQRELAMKIGTSASAICQLEDSDYDGHSLSLLKRIAEAIDKRVEIRFLPAKKLRIA